MYKPFMAQVNYLYEKYGDNFARMNGFHNDNLNFNDFIDNFIDSKNIGDVGIDANANRGSKDDG